MRRFTTILLALAVALVCTAKGRTKTADADSLHSAIARAIKNAQLEPDSFFIELERLERRYTSGTDTALTAVAHAMLGTGCEQMSAQYAVRFDDDMRTALTARRDEHFSHLLDNMEALRRADARRFVPYIDIMRDGTVYGHDMLAVMVAFAERQAPLKAAGDSIRARAARVYAACGMREAEAMMLLPTLGKEAAHELLMRMKDSEVGMDIAAACLSMMYRWSADDGERTRRNDEQIEFIRWARQNVKMSAAWANLEAREKEIMQPRVEASGDDCLLANTESRVEIAYNNVSQVTVEVRRYNGTTRSKTHGVTLRTDGALVASRTMATGTGEADEARRRENLPVSGRTHTSFTLPPGHYVMVCKAAGQESASAFRLSSMTMVAQQTADDKAAVYVLDAISGRPLKGVAVSGRRNGNDPSERQLTDASGMACFGSKVSQVMAERSAGDITEWMYVSTPRIWNESTAYKQACVYTDRAVYRPGHTVRGSVLVYDQDGDEAAVSSGTVLTLRIASPTGNWQQEVELSTNDMGTAGFEVPLPDDAEVGTYQLTLGSTKHKRLRTNGLSIKVEEYKRPTFEVKIEEVENIENIENVDNIDNLDNIDNDGRRSTAFSLGDSIAVVGRAMSFNGLPVQGGTVVCDIEYARASFLWWRNVSWEHVATMELATDSDGRFTVPTHLAVPHTIRAVDGDETDGLHLFRVKARVTEQSGETQEGEWNVRIGRQEYALSIDDNGLYDLDSPLRQLTVKAVNANGESVKAGVEYRLVSGCDTIRTGHATTGDAIALDAALPFGLYKLAVRSTDTKGNRIESTGTLWVHRSKTASTAFADDTDAHCGLADHGSMFMHTPSHEVSEQKAAEIYFAPHTADSYIYYNVYANGRLVESRQGVMNNGEHHIAVPYRSEWGDGFTVRMFYVRNGNTYVMSETFTYVKPEKRLTLTWSTFRDRLQPGAQEEWVMNVSDKDGKAVGGAEVMAVMYDAALDRIAQGNWHFGLTFPRNVPHMAFNRTYAAGLPRLTTSVPLHTKFFSREFDRLNPYRHDEYAGYGKVKFAAAAMPMMTRGMAKMDATEAEEEVMLAENVVTSTIGMREVDGLAMATADEVLAGRIAGMSTDDAAFDNATVRSNFAETAFFMPHLRSDAAGNVRIAFTLPESLTEWQFRALSHTAAMDYGLADTTVVARKLFMVRPNMPRFVRHGDRASIASAIINQSDGAIDGSVRMRLIDPETDEVVLTLTERFGVGGGKTENVVFSFDVLERYKDLDCEIVAVAGGTSDGEKNHLPVLSTKLAMVETVPFYLIGDEEKDIDLSALFNQNSRTATDRALAIDYTASPAWMCVDALRSVGVADDEDAISLAAAYHANSRLMLLSERAELAGGFDSEELAKPRLAALAASARDRLKRLQLGDGGWSWYSGMKSSYYTTLAVCEQLALIPNRSDEAEKMLAHGMRFLDECELKEHKERKRLKEKNLMPSESTLRYLYVSSLVPRRKVAAGVESMRRECLDIVGKHAKEMSVYGIANMSCALRAFGQTRTANSFVDMLRQTTVTKPRQGRFYVTNAAHYSWMDYRLPTQTAAMRAIMAKDANDPYLNDMRLWLIAQKQVQKWDNAINTIDAVDLLMQGEVRFSEDSESSENSEDSEGSEDSENSVPTITLDGKPVTNFRTATLNTERDTLEGRKANLEKMGNVVADIPVSYINNGVRSMTVKRPALPSRNGAQTGQSTPLEARKGGDAISWGFAQATFREETSRVKRYATDELSVDRKMYVLRDDEWVEIPSGKGGKRATVQLAVGDKVRIRHTVKADRDMDFVRLTAQHPACFEPVKSQSGYQWLGTRGGYVGIRDSRITVSFDWFTRGSATIDTEYHVSRAGEYEIGVSTVECAYAKQFGGHTTGGTVRVTQQGNTTSGK